ncbi:MAG TPA: rRNA maturation RNase YbeY [Candidatus Binatia bacterium]|nr:rRNA maturation RNase YbeY [Candidatus Binatia bacterium]
MGCTVTYHDRIGHDRIAQAVEPLDAADALTLIKSAICETVHTAFGKGPTEVELTLAGDAEMERLNFDHMGERGPTDVLSFPLHEWSVNGDGSHLTDDDGVSPPGPLLLGDVVLDLDQALRQSAEGNWGVTEELVLLAIHGTLHLLGHDHAEMEEEERMRRLEHQVLGVLHRRHRDIDWQPGSLFDRAGHAVTSGS